MSSVGVLVATLGVLIVPGILVSGLMRWPLRSVTTFAAVPVLSIGVIFLLAELMTLIGSRFGVTAFVCLLVLLVTALVLRARRDRVAQLRVSNITSSEEAIAQPSVCTVGESRGRTAPGPEFPGPASHDRLSAGLLATGIVFGLFIWVHGIRGRGVVPPQIDGANHGFFVARIVHTGSIDPSKVVVTDPGGLTKVAHYYPLGMHATAAIATELARAPVGRVLIDFAIIFAAVVFPLGMFALARFLAPQRVLVAGLTAFLTPVLVLYAYPAMQMSLLALLVAMAMVPVSVVAVAQALGVGSAPNLSARSRDLLPPALMVVAVTAVHPSEIPTLVLLVTLSLLGHLWRTRPALIGVLVRGFALLFIIVVLLAPTISGLASGSSERSSFDPFADSKPLSLGRAITQTVELRNASVTSEDLARVVHRLPPVQHTQVVFGVLAVIGAVICLRRRLASFVVAWGGVVALTVIAYASNGVLSRALTSPWYREGYRLAMNQAFFVPFFAAVVFEAALMGLVGHVPIRHGLLAGTAAIATLAVVTVGIQGYREADVAIRDTFGTDQMTTMPAAESAFSWLHHHARPNDTVINDLTLGDGSTWMYADANVRPLFAARAGDGNIALNLALQTPDLKAREDLWMHVDLLGSNARIDALALHYHARWIYYGEATMFPYAHFLRLPALRRNPHLQQVFQRDGIHVFQINFPKPPG